MSIKKELHEDIVVDEELMEEKASKEVDGESASLDVKKSIEGSAKAKAKPLSSAGKKDSMEKLKEEDEDEDDDEDEEEMEESFKEDLDALVESEATLSEGFRSKASLIFEAALNSKLSAEVSRLEESYETRLDEEVQEIRTDLVEKVDGYLNYVVEQWVEENQLAVEAGLRTEIAESFIDSLKSVFTEHYVEVPESKVDLVDELASKVESLEEKYSAAIDKNIELSESVDTLVREKIIVEASEGLSVAQAEKLKSLVEDVTFGNVEAFTNKVDTIKESYFKKSVSSEVVEEELNEFVENTDLSATMQRYVDALKTK